MRKITIILFMILSVSVAFGDVAIKTKQGNIFKWVTYYETDTSYCTIKKKLGEFCISKDDVIFIKEGDKEILPQETKIDKDYLEIECDAICFAKKKIENDRIKAQTGVVIKVGDDSSGSTTSNINTGQHLRGFIYTPPTETQKTMPKTEIKIIK